jgi:hypothetical protein
MTRRFLACAAIAAPMLLVFQGSALAQDEPATSPAEAIGRNGKSAGGERPLMVEYLAPAPPHCASVDAFQRLVAAGVAAEDIERVDWRFQVQIRQASGGEYLGRVTSASGVKTARSCDCADVTAALARAVAADDLEPVAPERQLEGPLAAAPSADGVPSGPPATGPSSWRLGARLETWSHGAWMGYFTTSDPGSTAPSYGGMATLSVELPWGFRKSMFEVGFGVMSSTATSSANATSLPSGTVSGIPPTVVSAGPMTAHITYYVLDTQSCLVDLPLGAGFSALGCLRVAAGAFQWTERPYSNGGGALWFGVGGRLRWQSPQSFYVEAQLNAVYGTVSGGEDTKPGWGDAAAAVGFRL